MKLRFLKAAALCPVALMLAVVSCSPSEQKTDAKPAAEKPAQATLPNYRYVDLDTLMAKYNLAKDFNEQMLSMQNNYESTVRQKQNHIQNYANQLQQKYQNNQYLTEADQRNIQSEQQKIANMQNSAQKEIAALETNIQNATLQAMQTVNDSIQNFIKQYNAKRGYDVIFNKAATLYIDERLDITDEVVEGLNARYNKIKK